jgi:GT2 family glycosyltransferase
MYIPERLLFGKNRFYNHTGRPMKVAHIVGADVMIQKAVFEQQNGFDPDFFMFCEETELELRITKSGYKIMSVPDACIAHLERKSFSNKFKRLEIFYNGRRVYLSKTKNKFEMHIINALHYLNIFLRIALFSVCRNKEKISYYSEIKKIFENSIGIMNLRNRN